eukprot:UN00245
MFIGSMCLNILLLIYVVYTVLWNVQGDDFEKTDGTYDNTDLTANNVSFPCNSTQVVFGELASRGTLP